jgi:large subunit ribosomal protein L5
LQRSILIEESESIMAAQEHARLKERYNKEIRLALKERLSLANIMQVPRLSKIVINVGLGRDAVSDSKVVQSAMNALKDITGRQPVRTIARKSIAGFKLREGMPLGAKVTLRGDRMYEFFDKLVMFALPEVRDFRGVSKKLDGNGGYNLGIKDWSIFPEIDYQVGKKAYGMNITIHTTSNIDDHARELLHDLGMPFSK